MLDDGLQELGTDQFGSVLRALGLLQHEPSVDGKCIRRRSMRSVAEPRTPFPEENEILTQFGGDARGTRLKPSRQTSERLTAQLDVAARDWATNRPLPQSSDAGDEDR